jgi:hypothetical protein
VPQLHHVASPENLVHRDLAARFHTNPKCWTEKIA